MRVAYLLDKHVVPSQTFVGREIEELRRQGVTVVPVALRSGDAGAPDDTIVVTELRLSPVRLVQDHLLAALRSPRRYARFLAGTRLVRSELWPAPTGVPARRLPTVARLLRDAGVDRLHGHFAWTGSAAALLLSRLTGWPWAMTVHANDMFAARRNLGAKLAEADSVVTVCDYNARVLREDEGFRRPLAVIPCGVEIPPAPAGEPADYDVVAVGRLVPKKGFDVLLEALAHLRAGRPETRAVVVGDGPLRAELAAQVAALGLGDHVRLVGALPHDDVLGTVGRSRLLCLPARIAPDGDRDSMPVVVKEALARGVPAVVTDAVGMREMVDDAVGRVVPADDAEALADALRQLLDLPPGDAQAMRAAARTRAEQRFDAAVLVGRLRREVLEPLPGREA